MGKKRAKVKKIIRRLYAFCPFFMQINEKEILNNTNILVYGIIYC